MRPRAIRSGDWKVIEFFEVGRKELYDLRTDESQTKNLAATNPEKTAEIHGKLVAWRKQISAPMPTPNKKASGSINGFPRALKLSNKVFHLTPVNTVSATKLPPQTCF